MLKASTVTVMARPAATIGQGEPKRLPSPSRMMLPQLALGGWVPRPRKLKVASRRTAVATHKVSTTTIEPAMLGRM